MINCKNCNTNYELTEADKKFYQEVGISEPAHCPQCRNIRRMSWRNDRSFYNRKCSLSGKQFISFYPPETEFPVYHPDEWYSDGWDPMDFGQEIDFTRPFFEQWNELKNKVPRLGIDIINCENSYYCNYCGDDKDCYLDIAGEGNEDCYYDLFTKYSKDCVDCTFVYNSELCYESINCYDCYRAVFSIYLENCSDCYFSYDLKGCKDCLFCTNLRQKQYCIMNKQYSKEEYEAKLKELNLGSYKSLQALKSHWKQVIEQAVHRDMYTLNSENCTGNNIKNSKNCMSSFNIGNCEDCKYLYDVLEAKDCYDLNYSLYHPEKSCELISTLSMKFSAFCMASHYCSDSFYTDLCNYSENLFGCIGLKRKKFCILNKQYSEDEYKALKSKLIEHMKSTGEWGEFFPSQYSPFGYNETVAQEYYPLNKEAAEKWTDKADENHYQGPKYQIEDSISDAPEDISKQILICEVSGKPYKVIPQEVRFYKSLGVALPRRSADQRHKDRIDLRNPRVLFERTCSKSGEKILSTYSSERPEKVYCEKDYLEFIN
jgi:hypothetical protein